MPKTRQQKEEEIAVLSNNIAAGKAVVFANFQGLKMTELDELRGQCREQGITCVASKKTLLHLALKQAGYDVDTAAFSGGVTTFVSNADEIAPAQIVAKYAKTHEMLTVFGGIFEKAFIDAAKVTALSHVPSRQELLAKLVGSINMPVSGFVNVLAGNLRGLVTVLNAVKDQKPA